MYSLGTVVPLSLCVFLSIVGHLHVCMEIYTHYNLILLTSSHNGDATP